jgi:hypothetical protein
MPRARRSLPVAAIATGALAFAGCGGFDVPTQSDASRLPAGRIRIGVSAVQRPPDGGRVRVTLLSYNPRERQRSAEEPGQIVAGIRLRIRNVGKTVVHASPPARFAVLLGIDGVGENKIEAPRGPCSGPFRSTPIRLAPGRSAQGCLPYSYPANKPPFEFVFGFGTGAEHHWLLPH